MSLLGIKYLSTHLFLDNEEIIKNEKKGLQMKVSNIYILIEY